MSWHDDVLEFMEAMGQFGEMTPEVLQLRRDLIYEEWKETIAALVTDDFPEFIDGLVDLCYVTVGAAVAMGEMDTVEIDVGDLAPGFPSPSDCVEIAERISKKVSLTLWLLEQPHSDWRSKARVPAELREIVSACEWSARQCGIDLRPVWDAVHAANMRKTTGPVAPNGKRLKPEDWTHPDIAGLLVAQGWNP